MLDQLQQVLSMLDVDYADIRYEIKKTANIGYSKDELVTLSANTTDGYVLRVLKNGGFSSVVFTRFEDAREAARQATQNAMLLAARQKKPVALAPVDPVQGTFLPPQIEDPRALSMEEKLALVRAYNDIPLKYEKVAATRTSYNEIVREKYFMSTEGARIREDLVTPLFAMGIVAMEGRLTQDISVSGGGSNGFQNIRGLEALIEERTGLAIDLLNAEPVKGGIYNCVLNPSMTGVFTHEAFGHFSEADIIERLPAMRARMHLGAKLGN